ncbi:zinc transporter foi [Anopheles nili]|uniref:zinc transporter foi n=1 Tax=Anopheles nili TaxID=185578 RepID=UPI00237B125D|nr:zinc transporter foi [Anopheles nili]
MARHIMAVCVVCLLCADHVPCKQHFSDDGGQSMERDREYQLASTFGSASVNRHNEREHRIVKRHQHHHHHDHDEEPEKTGDSTTEFDRLLKEKVEQFVLKIFTDYGDPETMTMGVKGFESMMRQLDMYRLVSGGEAASELDVGSGVNQPLEVNSSKCINSSEFLRRVTPPRIRSQEWEEAMAARSDTSSNETDEKGSNSTPPIVSDERIQNLNLSFSNSTSSSNNTNANGDVSNNSNSSSLSSDERMIVHVHVPEDKINSSSSKTDSTVSLPLAVQSTAMFGERDLYNVCPLLLAHLLSKEPLERAGCYDADSVPSLQVSSLLEHNDPHHNHHHHGEGGSSEAAVWIYSSVAILGVSLCGLLGVAVIPCMDKHFYHHVLQFLVALAVGTLCGDALLHLLPHAMISSVSNANAHDLMMYKGLAAVLGIVFFYFMERFLNVIAEWNKTRAKKDKPPSRVRVMRDPESTSLHASSAGEKQCKHKYSSYPYCYDEIAMDTKDDHHEHNTGTNENHNSALAKCANRHQNGELATDHSIEYSGMNNHQSQREDATDNNTVSTNLDDGSIESEQVNNHHGARQGSKSSETAVGKLRPENYTIILREHETKHHGHSHTHGHVHSPPGSLSAVAWMVVMGDGLHNFTDGMTIGAAFANNIAGGFSTAIAVFCHELPHELGDFAVLLKAGMSAREAVYYNLLSSLLSLLGMVVGIIVGHQPDASAWVFAVAAGMFLYIAMVDMIPELTSSHGAEKRCKTSEFLLQFLGLTVGFSIMMIIAMYEHDLMELFVD